MDVENPGLTLSEVKKENCVKTLEMAGVLKDDIEETFLAADANEDGIVMKSEVRDSLKEMELLRCSRCDYCKSESGKLALDSKGSWVPVWDCSGTTSCYNCSDCKCPSKAHSG